MIKCNFRGLQLPKIGVAVSGGVDSMAALDFLKNSGREIIACFYDHGTEADKEAYHVVLSYCMKRDITLRRGGLKEEKPKGRSLEDWWRENRYKFLHSFDFPVVTAHQLDDCVETWIFSSLHGQGKLIPYNNGKNIFRPFRLTRKSDFRNWCRNKNVPWFEDEGNTDVKFMRNYIRHELLPKTLVVNPGLYKVIAKKITNETD